MQAADLISHLRSTGTGEAKLAELEKLNPKDFAGPEEYLSACASVVPGGTVAKIAAYLEAHGPPKPVKPAKSVVEAVKVEAKAPEAKTK